LSAAASPASEEPPQDARLRAMPRARISAKTFFILFSSIISFFHGLPGTGPGERSEEAPADRSGNFGVFFICIVPHFSPFGYVTVLQIEGLKTFLSCLFLTNRKRFLSPWFTAFSH
jgi:hypothetical protein